MKINIKDVFYNRGYVIGPYLQERPGVSADVVIEEGEDSEECTLKALHYLKSITDKFNQEANPHLDHKASTPGSPLPDIQTKKTPEEYTINQLADDINSCQHINDIESYKLMVRTHPILQSAYDTRLKELTDDQPT